MQSLMEKPCPRPLSLSPSTLCSEAGAQTRPLPAQAWDLALALSSPSWATKMHSPAQNPMHPRAQAQPYGEGVGRAHSLCPGSGAGLGVSSPGL